MVHTPMQTHMSELEPAETLAVRTLFWTSVHINRAGMIFLLMGEHVLLKWEYAINSLLNWLKKGISEGTEIILPSLVGYHIIDRAQAWIGASIFAEMGLFANMVIKESYWCIWRYLECKAFHFLLFDHETVRMIWEDASILT